MVESTMRALAIVLGALVIVLSAPVLAKSEKAASPPHSASNGGGNSGRANGDKPDPPGQAKKDETPAVNNGHGSNGGTPPTQGSAPSVPPGQAMANEADEAQRAVEAREALPLARIVAVAETRSTGRVINARLVRVDGVLLYALTLLDDAGRSWREYYHASTGNPMAIP